MLLCICSVIDCRWCRNVVRTECGTWGGDHSWMCHWCSYHILKSPVNRCTATWNQSISYNKRKRCHLYIVYASFFQLIISKHQSKMQEKLASNIIMYCFKVLWRTISCLNMSAHHSVPHGLFEFEWGSNPSTNKIILRGLFIVCLCSK